MTRERWFCSLCGAMTTRRPRPGQRYARCAAHEGLPQEGDLIPPDPAETLPTLAEEVLAEWRLVDKWWTAEPDCWEYRELRAAGGGCRTERRREGGEWVDVSQLATNSQGRRR